MKLFSTKELENLIFIDIETTSEHKHIDDMGDTMGKLWSKRCEYLRRKHKDNEDLSDNEIYEEKAALQAEFGKIVCISIGYIRYNKDNEPVVKIKTYSNEKESDLIKEFFDFVNQLKVKLPNSKFCGHNINNFDIPFINKRGWINEIEIPSMLMIYDKKPWEIPTVDTMKMFSSGAWNQGFTSLDIMCGIFNIPTSKDDIDGSEVGRVYWKENDLNRIVEYCEKDVFATCNLVLKMNFDDIIEDFISL